MSRLGSKICVACASVIFFASAQLALAQIGDWPNRPVKIIVPTAAGGSIDMTARTIAAKLQDKWGRAVIIENKPGAAMRIGADFAAKSEPDGYTLLVAHDGTMAMNPVVYNNLPYDPQKDFAPLALIVSIPEAIMVHKSVPANNLQELILLAQQRPGALNHASGGTATLLALELLKSMAKIDIKSVPFNGGAPAVNALMSGVVEVLIADIVTAGSALQSKDVKVLAVTTLKSQPTLPGVPSAHDSGVFNYDVQTWMGAFAPARTPKAILTKIEADIAEAMNASDVRKRFESIGMTLGSGGGEEMRKLLAADISKWRKVVSEAGIKISQ
jgi:tripartite-type tricarboxylate transporter receptor subunit TctC